MRFSIFAILTMAVVGLCVPALPALSAEEDLEVEVKDPELLPGDKAPAFTVEKFVRGDEFKNFEKGKVYVVECWATWCGPCLASIPHLTELQEKHPEIKVVGIAVSDPDIEGIKAFVEEQGDKMAYTVAWEGQGAKDKRPAFSKNWMDAAGANGIPHAFVVDGTGKIAWMGHPMRMDEPLASVIEGKWDAKKFREEHLTALRSEAFMSAYQQKLGELQQADETDAMLAMMEKYDSKSDEIKEFNSFVRFMVYGSKPKYAKQMIAALKDFTADPSKVAPRTLLQVMNAALGPNDADELTATTAKWPNELKQAVKKATEDKRLAEVNPLYAKIVAAKGHFIVGEKDKAAKLLNDFAETLTDPQQGRAKLFIQNVAKDLGGIAEEEDKEKEDKE